MVGTPSDTVLDAAVASAAAELAAELADRQEVAGRKLAVTPFRAGEPGSGLARDLRHRVGDHLHDSAPRLVLVERDDLEALWREHRLSASGLLDPEATAELGRVLGADMLLLGELVEVERQTQLHLRIVDVATAVQLAAATRPLATAAETAAPASGGGGGVRPLLTGPDVAAGDVPGATGEPPSAGEPAAAAPSVPGRVVVGDFRLALAGCGFVEQQVVCRVEIENLAPGTRTLTVLGTTRIHDTRGEDYRLQRVRLGTRVDDVLDLDDAVSSAVPGGLEATLELTFSGVPRQKRKLQLVALRFAEGACGFPDVPLARD